MEKGPRLGPRQVLPLQLKTSLLRAFFSPSLLLFILSPSFKLRGGERSSLVTAKPSMENHMCYTTNCPRGDHSRGGQVDLFLAPGTLQVTC